MPRWWCENFHSSFSLVKLNLQIIYAPFLSSYKAVDSILDVGEFLETHIYYIEVYIKSHLEITRSFADANFIRMIHVDILWS